MLGRKMNEVSPQKSTDVLVFAAHPDDDVLGLSSTLYRHSLNGENIKVIFVTNGTGDQGYSWYLSKTTSNNKANLRYHEALQALSQINIPQENIYCLGFPDGGTQRYLREMSNDVSEIIQYLNPRKIYVHCIEGGHIDHDMTSFAVKTACRQLNYDEVYEWAEYNCTTQLIGSEKVKFPSSDENSEKGKIVNISEEERILKRRMLSCHKSQDVEQYYMQGEAIRKANTSNCVQELYDHGRLAEPQLKTVLQEFSQSCSINQGSKYSTSLQQKSVV